MGKGLDIDVLRTFQAVARLGRFKAAADYVHRSPSAVMSLKRAPIRSLADAIAFNRAHAAETMPSTVAPHMPTAAQIAACRWLPDDALAVYVAESARTGFQGGLQWYRCRTTGLFEAELQIFAGRRIDVPSVFIAGASDWGIHQVPGALDRMQREACTRMLGCHLVDGAGHWVQQERPEAVIRPPSADSSWNSKRSTLASCAASRGTGPLAEVPTWRELGIAADYVSYNGVLLPPGVDAEQIRFWENALRQVSQSPEWRAMVEKSGNRPVFKGYVDSHRYLEAELNGSRALVASLGMGTP